MGSRQRLPLLVRSLWRIPFQRLARGKRRRWNLSLLHRFVQLLQLRQLGLPTVLRFLEYAMVFHRRASSGIPDKTFEDRALVYQRMAIVRFSKSHAGTRRPT